MFVVAEEVFAAGAAENAGITVVFARAPTARIEKRSDIPK
jgi:hypothetical protein